MNTLAYTRGARLPDILKQRIVVLDGAMGTMIQRHHLVEDDYRGERFKDHPKGLKGNYELLAFSRPDVVRSIHEAYLEAGADIVETNTFGATRVAQEDYGLGHVAREMNVAAARLAREACDKFASADKPRFVAGALGPTPRTASISPDVNDPAARNVTFEELRAGLPRTGGRAARRRLRPVPGRDHLRHAECEGRDLRARRTDGRHAASGCR